MNNRLIIDYIWLDGHSPQNLRSKVKTIKYNSEVNGPISLNDIPVWDFDGSSTMQAPGSESECVLNPVRLYNHGNCQQSAIVLCEVLDSAGKEHITNMRASLRAALSNINDTFWWWYEQE